MSFGQTWTPPPRLRDMERPPQKLARSVNFAGGTSGIAIEKGEKAKPGKRTPNKAEREWMDAIVAHGCVACRMDGVGFNPPCVHHILRGGRRIGHLFTLPLCPGHHQAGTGAPGLIARHPDRARFERKYGSEEFLLHRLQITLGFMKEGT
jgi:hypothetical protein